MKKFFTLVLMLFASLQLFANAEIVIYNNSTGTTVTNASSFTISSNNFKNIVEEGDYIVVTVSAYTRTSEDYPYFQIEWGTWEGWNNSGIGDLSKGENAIPLTAADVTKINESTTNGVNFRTNGTTSYTITKVVLRKNDSYSDLVELTLTDKATTANDTKAKIIDTNCINISDGDIIVVETTTDSHSDEFYYIQNLSTWSTYDNASGNFDGRDFAYKVPSGTGATMRSAGIVIKGENNTDYLIEKVYLAKKIYSLSEETNFDFSSVVTDSPVNVKLTRSITAGNWSTIVLPFALTAAQIETVFGSEASVAEFTGGDAEKLNFTTTLTGSEMKANQPYAIKVTSDFSSATISGVTIESGTLTQGTTNWNFVGTYTSGNIPEGSYFFQDNKLYYASGSSNHIKPFRAYFTPIVATTRGFVGFSVDGQTTGINSTLYDSINKGDDKIYSLSGQLVNSPSKGVVYIVNGKKVIYK